MLFGLVAVGRTDLKELSTARTSIPAVQGTFWQQAGAQGLAEVGRWPAPHICSHRTSPSVKGARAMHGAGLGGTEQPQMDRLKCLMNCRAWNSLWASLGLLPPQKEYLLFVWSTTWRQVDVCKFKIQYYELHESPMISPPRNGSFDPESRPGNICIYINFLFNTTFLLNMNQYIHPEHRNWTWDQALSELLLMVADVAKKSTSSSNRPLFPQPCSVDPNVGGWMKIRLPFSDCLSLWYMAYREHASSRLHSMGY